MGCLRLFSEVGSGASGGPFHVLVFCPQQLLQSWKTGGFLPQTSCRLLLLCGRPLGKGRICYFGSASVFGRPCSLGFLKTTARSHPVSALYMWLVLGSGFLPLSRRRCLLGISVGFSSGKLAALSLRIGSFSSPLPPAAECA